MEISLVYPNQLYRNHPALAAGRSCYLLEDPMSFGNDSRWPMPMHKQKLVLHRASMAAFANRRGDARIIENPGGKSVDGIAWLDAAIPGGVTDVHFCDPVDEVVERRLAKLAVKRGIKLHRQSSPNFLTPGDFLNKYTGSGTKRPFMAKFYQAQRSRMNVLLEADGSPLGGQWSFDADNRKKLPKTASVPLPPQALANGWVRDAIRHVEEKFPDHPGQTAGFRWAVTHDDAKSWMDAFFAERFGNFGIYEDAIAREHAFINHSALTPMLNIGLLDPGEIVDAAIHAAANRPEIPLNSLEGFIRQVIGWREFMCGIYRFRGSEIRNGNFWQCERPMPSAFYDGTTGIPPIDRVIRQVLREGWCHHIERLMVLGNFMLLCRIRPDDVYRWFMELFIDAYDWVMVPNVYGMSQFADGGTFTTKPYISGSNYILKMSDEPKGPWCEVWDGLFWSFIGDHADFFLRNPRLSMMARNWEKMGPQKQMTHRKHAQAFLNALEGGAESA
ncbi:MAG: cryptochrome/photolyase family protein [Luteolibacter sp.]